jgi:hypothetical protein
MTSQKAELTALARALTLAKTKTINIYTDSKYAFHTLLSHSAIWKKRGLLTTKGTPIINAALITQVLEASYLPSPTLTSIPLWEPDPDQYSLPSYTCYYSSVHTSSGAGFLKFCRSNVSISTETFPPSGLYSGATAPYTPV